MTKRAWALLAALGAVGIIGHAELARAGSTVFGLLRITIGGVEQGGVAALELPSGSTCDGGGCIIGGGGGAALPDGGPDNAIVRADGITGAIQVSLITVDDSGNVTMPSSATFDGRDVSVDGAKLDGIPASAVATSAVSPQPDGGVSGTLGSIPFVIRAVGGYTVNGDAGYMMPNGGCSVTITANQLCRVQVQWFGKIVGGLDANNIPTGENFIRRTYQIRNASNVLTVTTVQGETDRLSAGAGTAVAGSAADAAVFQPWIQGAAATNVVWECEVTGYACTAS